jgi:transposase
MAQPVRALVDGVDEFIGIDHHKKRCQVMVKDRQGHVLRRGNIPTQREALERFLGDRNGAVRLAVFEAGPRYRPLYRWLAGLADQVVMANPGRLKIISETAYKDDAIDAEKLADFGMLGMVPEAYVCGDEAWDRRQGLRQRAALVKMQTSVKNRVHALVDQHPNALPARPEATDLFGSLGMQWLREVVLPETDRGRLDQLLEVYTFLHDQVRQSDAQVRQMVKADVRCGYLATMPGIGDFFAALILAEVDDIRRFPTSKDFVSYTGLVPGRDRSDEVDKPRRMHKRGSKWLRWALVEAAIPATRSNLALKNLYDRVVRKKGPKAGPNVAKVAVARKLAEIVYRILVEERPYEVR